MELTDAQYRQIESCLPTPRGNVTLDHLQVLNAIVYVAEHSCKWRGLPKQFGNWHTISTRMNRWSKNGVLDRVFTQLPQAQIIRVKREAVALDSTIVKVHPDGTGALKKRPASHWPISRRMDHHDASGCRGCSNGPNLCPVVGPAHDAPEERKLRRRFGKRPCSIPLLMDRASEGDETRQLAVEFGYVPVVPPKQNHRTPWEYDSALYIRRNVSMSLGHLPVAFREGLIYSSLVMCYG